MTPEEHADAYFGLLEDLEDLFGPRVELVEIRAVRNPYLRREIKERQETLVGTYRSHNPFLPFSWGFHGSRLHHWLAPVPGTQVKSGGQSLYLVLNASAPLTPTQGRAGRIPQMN